MTIRFGSVDLQTAVGYILTSSNLNDSTESSDGQNIINKSRDLISSLLNELIMNIDEMILFNKKQKETQILNLNIKNENLDYLIKNNLNSYLFDHMANEYNNNNNSTISLSTKTNIWQNINLIINLTNQIALHYLTYYYNKNNNNNTDQLLTFIYRLRG